MKEISVSELQDNMFDAIGKEWMLVTQLLSSLFVRNVIHTSLSKKEIS